MVSTYSQFQPDDLDRPDCPCANNDEGFDPGCPEHGVDSNGEER